jgi:glycosyltransferase involved in cell wall biosynthesis
MDLSILIPARNEMFLAKTIENALENIRGETEIIAVCDGGWADPPIKDHPRVHIMYYSESIGQRAATNEAAKISRAKFIMKVDAHCAFDEGFDVKLMADAPYDWTVVPRMYNLHAFNWRCKSCGNETYQGPTPTSCSKCDNKTEFERVIYWKEKRNPTSDFMRFDSELHFQYWNEFKKRPESKGDLCPTMSLIGACWFMHRERYWELDGMDERHGSWGQMGTEIACKAWLSGGALMVNKKTWFAHMFRTQGGDFGFPYPNSGVSKARKHSKWLWKENNWPKAKYPLDWLINKFAPVLGWEDFTSFSTKEIEKPKEMIVEELLPAEPPVNVKIINTIVENPYKKSTVGILYYTDNELDPFILNIVLSHLKKYENKYEIVVVSLKPLDFKNNIILNLKRSHLTMTKQQLAGLLALDTDIVFMAEHDVIYPKCHFEFIPEKNKFYYNLNWWKVREGDGQALHFKAKQVSGLCAYRDILIEYFSNRVKLIESGEIGGRRHFEPDGKRKYRDEGYGKLTNCEAIDWMSKIPYVDIRHGRAVTRNIYDPKGYRGQVTDWTLADEVPFWGRSKGRFLEFLEETKNALSQS